MASSITVRYLVTPEFAVKHLLTLHGIMEYQPSSMDLAELTEEERLFSIETDAYGKQTIFPIHSCAGNYVTWADVCNAIRTKFAANKAKLAKEKEALDERVNAALSKSDEEWKQLVRSGYYASMGMYRTDLDDPRVQEKMRALRKVVAAEEAENRLKREAEDAERRAATERQEEERKAAKAVKDSKEAAWAAAYVKENVPEFSRAATEGKNCFSPAKKHLMEKVSECLGALGEDLFTDTEVEDWEEDADRAYSNKVYQIEDSAKAAIGALMDADTLEIFPVNFWKGSAKVGNTGKRRTFVNVYIKHLDGLDLYLYADTAPIPEERDEDY